MESSSRLRLVVLSILTASVFLPSIAQAYVGPGAGITMLAALWAVILAIVATIGAVLFWPIRAMLRKRKNAKAAASDDEKDAPANASEPELDERPD